MEQTTPPRLPHAFGPWLHDQLVRRGYQMAGRGGGQRAFADDAGITPTTVSRLLRGENRSDPDTLRIVAAALGIPVAEIFVRAGLLTEDDIAAIRDRGTARRTADRITPEQAVADLGITDPAATAAIVAAITAVQPRPRPREADDT